MLGEEQLMRYSRNILLPQIGSKGQQRLLDARVLIIGAGGLGSPAAQYLAAAGVGTIGIADDDCVDITNLQRQILHFTADVGRKKVFSLTEKLNQLNPDICIIAEDVRVSSENIISIISGYDFVIDGTDNFDSKFLINDACVKQQIAFSHAGVLQFLGQTLTWVPGQDIPCYRCIFTKPPEARSIPTCQQAGVLGPVVGAIGTIQAIECLKYLLGAGNLLAGQMLVMDFAKMETSKITLSRQAHCPACSAPSDEIVLPDNSAQANCKQLVKPDES